MVPIMVFVERKGSTDMDLKTKLLSRVDVREDGCWMWLGGKDSNQYGQISYDGMRQRTHIVSYEVHIGPVPKGVCVCHTCDNTWCVNPEHLFLGTKKDNYEDMRSKGRAHFNIGEEHPFAILKESDVLEIRQMLLFHTQQEIADHFGVSRSAIRDIKLGIHWRHL